MKIVTKEKGMAATRVKGIALMRVAVKLTKGECYTYVCTQ